MTDMAGRSGAVVHFSVCIWALLLGLASPVRALVGDRDDAFGIDGSLRTITGASYNYDYPLLFSDRSDGFSQSILRLEAGGQPVDWFSYEIHGVQDLNLTTSGQQFGGSLFGSSSAVMYRASDLSYSWAEEERVTATVLLDRLAFKFAAPWFDIVVGRQAITFGKAYFWNPLDVFLAFDPRSFDRDYKAGVDALRLDIPLGDFSGITLVGVAGRNDTEVDFGASWYGSAVLARAFTTLWDWDFAVQGGKIFGGYQAGLAASGEAGPLEIRVEGAYFVALTEDPVPDHFSGVFGLGHRFEFDLTIEAEYLYNGSGEPDNMLVGLERMGAGRTFHLGQHMFGLMADYQILPILRSSLAWIFSVSDYSSLVQPGFVLSVSDEADFIFGAMIALGARPRTTTIPNPLDPDGDPITLPDLKSEFGSYPNFYYMEFKFYF